MHFSKATVAVLMSAMAVHALPIIPAGSHSTSGDDVDKAVDQIVGGVSGTVKDIFGGISDLIESIKGPKDTKDDEAEEKLRAALEERLKIAQDQLRHTEAEQAEAEQVLNAADEAHDKSRADLAQINELIAKVGIPEEDLELLDPDHPEVPEVPEVP